MTSKNNTSSKQTARPDVKGQLSEFYKVAKEKLLAVKNDVETSKKEYETQKEINRKKELEYNELVKESKLLALRIKGMNEKLLIAKRTESNLESQINLTKAQIANGNSEIDYMKIETDQKVQKVQNDAKMIENVKQNFLKSIQDRMEKEKETNEKWKEKIKEVEARIKELTYSLENAYSEENKKKNAILNEAAEMNKFLSEL